MIDLYRELADLLGAFEQDQLDYALCGALALAVHGHPRATRDIDLLALPEDLDRITRAARRSGYTLEALPMTFASTGIKVKRLSKIVEGKPLMLDVLLVNDDLRPIWEGRIEAPWAEGRIFVVSREGLISLKLTAGRAQDLADVERLAKAGDDGL